MIVALYSPDKTLSPLEIGNYASNNVVNELRRVPGVGDIQLFGSQYAMRIWLDPAKLAGFALSASDVLTAVQEQNSQIAGGGLGEQPVTRESEFTAKIVAQNRFSTAEQFRAIIVRAGEDGATGCLGDVARVELGNDSYGFKARLNRQEIAGLGVQLGAGANAVATATAVKERLGELQANFPKGLVWSVGTDTAP